MNSPRYGSISSHGPSHRMARETPRACRYGATSRWCQVLNVQPSHWPWNGAPSCHMVLVDDQLVTSFEQFDERDGPGGAGDLDVAVDLHHRQRPPRRGDGIAFVGVLVMVSSAVSSRWPRGDGACPVRRPAMPRLIVRVPGHATPTVPSDGRSGSRRSRFGRGVLRRPPGGGGRDVVACARRPFDEYVIESASMPARAPANVVTDPADVEGPAEWVLVAVKSHQTAAAAPWLDRLCGPDTTVVVLQNGIEGEERLAPLSGAAEVVASVVYCATEHGARLRRAPPVADADRPRARGVGPLRRAVRRHPCRDPGDRRLPHRGVAQARDQRDGQRRDRADRPAAGRLRRPDIGLLGRRLLLESWAVAAADGAELSATDVDTFFAGFDQVDPDGPTSMLQDRRAGRATEHDALYGAVVRAGARLGIATPLAETFGALLAAIDDA